jgi:chemotaxis protein MotA
MRAPKALTMMADGLPALGIVAAVLGVIKAMGSISEPPEVLGHMIGSALVGTLLGVFLAYGLVGPLAVRLKGVIEEEATMLGMVRQVIVSHLEGLAPQLAVEVGRKAVPSKLQPSFEELDQVVNEVAKSVRAKVDG